MTARDRRLVAAAARAIAGLGPDEVAGAIDRAAQAYREVLASRRARLSSAEITLRTALFAEAVGERIKALAEVPPCR